MKIVKSLTCLFAVLLVSACNGHSSATFSSSLENTSSSAKISSMAVHVDQSGATDVFVAGEAPVEGKVVHLGTSPSIEALGVFDVAVRIGDEDPTA